MKPDNKCVNFILNGSAEFSSLFVLVTLLWACLLLLIISYLIPPFLLLMAASTDFTPRIYQAALILKLINNSDKTALSLVCKDSQQSKEKLKEINSPLFLQHLNTALTAPSVPHITLHCQLLDIRRVFNWGPSGDGKNMGRVRQLAWWGWDEAHRPIVKQPKRC